MHKPDLEPVIRLKRAVREMSAAMAGFSAAMNSFSFALDPYSERALKSFDEVEDLFMRVSPKE